MICFTSTFGTENVFFRECVHAIIVPRTISFSLVNLCLLTLGKKTIFSDVSKTAAIQSATEKKCSQLSVETIFIVDLEKKIR